LRSKRELIVKYEKGFSGSSGKCWKLHPPGREPLLRGNDGGWLPTIIFFAIDALVLPNEIRGERILV
jgi:hypothetical protein